MAARAAAAAPASLLRGVRLGGSWQRAALLAPAVIILIAFLVAGIFADLLSAYDPEQIVLQERLIPPAFQDGGSIAHPLGTDNLGRDILARVMY
ncbi:MAG: ABC transporter permease, partial [Chloroflexi bacterium]|nr:ABC transporter permease [Chloroflexota bacterium]